MKSVKKPHNYLFVENSEETTISYVLLTKENVVSEVYISV